MSWQGEYETRPETYTIAHGRLEVDLYTPRNVLELLSIIDFAEVYIELEDKERE